MSSRGISSKPRGRQRLGSGSRLFTRLRQKFTGSTKPAARPSDPDTQRKDDEGLLALSPSNLRPEAAQSLNSLDPSYQGGTGLLSVPPSNVRPEVTKSLNLLSPSDGGIGNGLTCHTCGRTIVSNGPATPPHSVNSQREHLKTDQFGEDLMKSFNGNIPRSRNKYPAARVLLIRWESDNLGVATEIKLLEDLFVNKFNFPKEWIQHCVLPGENRGDSEKAGDHLSKAIKRFRSSAAIEDLLIIYYGGHGVLKEDRRSYWTAHQRVDIHGVSDSPQIPWYPEQHKLEEYAENDILIILDCCYAATAGIRGPITKTNELLAASGISSTTWGVSGYSFTRRLIHAIQKLLRTGPFTVSALYNEVLSSPINVEFPNRTWTVEEIKFFQRTPIYVPLSQNGQSITLAPFVNSSSPRSLPGNSTDGSTPNVPNFSGSPFVMLTFALEGKVPPSPEALSGWLLALLPIEVKRLTRVELVGAFEHQSMLIIASTPLAIWNLLPKRPAYSFIDLVDSENLLPAVKGLPTNEPLPSKVEMKVTPSTTLSLMPVAGHRTNLKGMDEFSKDLMQVTRGKKFSQISKYNSAVVLYLAYEDDLERVGQDDKVDDLQYILRGVYHFEMERCLLLSSYAEEKLIRILSRRVLPKLLEPPSLLIIHYSGGLFIGDDGKLYLTPSDRLPHQISSVLASSKHRIDWSRIQQTLGKAQNVLFLIDGVCELPILNKENLKGFINSFLGGDKVSQQCTREIIIAARLKKGPLLRSFTERLVQALRHSRGEDFSVKELFDKIQAIPQNEYDEMAIEHFCNSQSIILPNFGRTESFGTLSAQQTPSHRETSEPNKLITLTLRLRNNAKPTVKNWAKWIEVAPAEVKDLENVKVEEVQMQGTTSQSKESLSL